ncbi:conserved hypothetical protein, partial [Pseudomonas aeruginosa C3719]
MQFVSRLIEFATNHYLLVAALLVLLVLLLLHELRKGGKSLSTRELTALVNADQAERPGYPSGQGVRQRA